MNILEAANLPRGDAVVHVQPLKQNEYLVFTARGNVVHALIDEALESIKIHPWETGRRNATNPR